MEEKLLNEVLLEIIKLNNKFDAFREENAAEHKKMIEQNAAEHKKMREENEVAHKKMMEINMNDHREIMDTLLEIIETGDKNSQTRIISLENKVFGKNKGIKLMETTNKYKT